LRWTFPCRTGSPGTRTRPLEGARRRLLAAAAAAAAAAVAVAAALLLLRRLLRLRQRLLWLQAAAVEVAEPSTGGERTHESLAQGERTNIYAV
jgi:hypothetical protein